MNLFKATVKALKTALGPLGAPFEFIITDIEDMESEEKHIEILTKIENGEQISKEMLEKLTNLNTEFSETQEQFIIAFETLVKSSISDGWNDNFIKGLDFIGFETKEALDNNGVISKRVLVKELSRLYNLNETTFLNTISDAGFDTTEITAKGDSMKSISSSFLTRISGYKIERQIDIFNALFESNDGSKILQRTYNLLIEKYQSAKSK